MTFSQFQNLGQRARAVLNGTGLKLKPKAHNSDRRHTVLSGLGVLGLGIMGCSPKVDPKSNEKTAPALKGKTPSPTKHTPALKIDDFSFLTPDNKTVKLSDFNGRYRLLNLWATWCAPCIVELPSLASLSQSDLGQRLMVMVLSVDDEGSRAKVLDRIKSLKGLIAYHDPYFAAPKALGPEGMPTTYLFDPNGDLIAEWAGEADWHSPSMINQLEVLIKP